mgnify:CR=1 FL=1
MKDKKKLILVISIAVVLISSLLLLFNYINLKEEENSLKGKIGYVNIQQVFNSHPLKKDAEDELNKLAQDMQLELENKLEDVPKEEHQKMINDYQQRLSKKEKELVNNIVDKIEQTIHDIAQDKEMKVVIEEQDVVKGGQDITQLVMQRIENK